MVLLPDVLVRTSEHMKEGYWNVSRPRQMKGQRQYQHQQSQQPSSCLDSSFKSRSYRENLAKFSLSIYIVSSYSYKDVYIGCYVH